MYQITHKKNITNLLAVTTAIIFSAPILQAATGFIVLGTTNDGTTATLSNTTTFDVSQDYVTNTTSGNISVTMTAGTANSLLPTRLERDTSWAVTGDPTGFIDISLQSLGSADREITRNIPNNTDLIISAGEEANTQYRMEFTVVGNVSEIIITHDYSVGWSPFGTRVWEGIALAQSARAEMQLFDENLTAVDLTSVLWGNTGYYAPNSYEDGGLTAVRNTGSRDLRINRYDDGDTTDDFIGKAVYTLTPITGDYFAEGAFFAHTVNGQTFANAPTVPEPSTTLLLTICLTSFTFYRRKR